VKRWAYYSWCFDSCPAGRTWRRRVEKQFLRHEKSSTALWRKLTFMDEMWVLQKRVQKGRWALIGQYLPLRHIGYRQL
jgi:hypothetical protein